MTDHDVVEVASREVSVARMVEALSALKTGRNGGQETLGLPAPMRRAAAEGLIGLGFRFVGAVATHKVVMPENTWLGPHAIADLGELQPEAAREALESFSPALAAKYRDAITDEQRQALREELRPKVESTLETGLDLDEAASALRMHGRHEAAMAREERDAAERGE
jgi:hypothetical protein